MDPSTQRPRRGPLPWLAGGLAAAGVAAWMVARANLPEEPSLGLGEPREESSVEVVQAEQPGPDPREVYDREVAPLLTASAERHEQAIQRIVRLVEEEFDRFEAGVEPFVRDLTSLRTRGRVLWRSAKDWVGEEGEVEQLVAEAFERHLFSEDELAEFLTLALEHAAEEFEADRNKLVRDARTAVDAAGLPELELPSYEGFAADVATRLQETSRSMAKSSAWGGVGTLLLSEAAATAATALLARAIPALVAGAGGATVAGGASGGAGGTLAGPIGTGIGLVGGFLVGAVIDAWLTEGLEEELGGRLDALLEGVRRSVLFGDGDAPGLEPLLREHARLLEEVQGEVLERTVLST